MQDGRPDDYNEPTRMCELLSEGILMPKITFEKEVTPELYEVYQMVLKLDAQTSEQYIWGTIRRAIIATLESANESPLLNKAGWDEEEEEEEQN